MTRKLPAAIRYGRAGPTASAGLSSRPENKTSKPFPSGRCWRWTLQQECPRPVAWKLPGLELKALGACRDLGSAMGRCGLQQIVAY